MGKVEQVFKKIENIFNSKYGTAYAYGIIFILCFFIMVGQNFRIEINNDDVYYMQVLKEHGSAYNFMKYSYNNINGRYFTALVMAYVMDKDILLWRILNTLILFSLIYYSFQILKTIYKLDKSRSIMVFFCVFTAFALFKNDIINWSITWVTGSFNYLYSSASLVAVLYYIINYTLNHTKLNINNFIVLILFTLYACNVEQSTLILLTIFTISIIYSLVMYKKYDLLLFILYIIGIISAYILFTSPATAIRYVSVEKYPMFFEISLYSKALYGFAYTVLFGFILKNYAISMILSFLLYFILKKQYNNKLHEILLLSIFAYTLIYYIFTRINFFWINETWLYNIVNFSMQALKNHTNEPYLSFILIFMFLIVIIYSIFKIQWSSKLNLILTLLFFSAAYVSAFILSFTPTIYESGARIWFIPSIMYVLGIGMIFNETLRYIDISSTKFKTIFAVIFIVSSIDIISKVYV